MSNSPPYITFLEEQLDHISTIRFKPMFGGHSIYVQDEVVGMVCDDKLYIKELKASASLADICELEPAYAHATPSYYVTDDLLDELDLKEILNNIAIERK